MKLEFSIYRYNPDVDNAPHMQDYTLDAEEGRDMMLLDALIQLKEKDPTLSFRRSCREGVCGSDGLNMNGKNGLACITPISALQKGNKKIVIRPLPGLPVVRDLVVDMGQFYTQYEKIKPYLLNDGKNPPAREHLQSPEQRAKLMVCMNAYCALAAQRLVRHSGGIQTSLLARLGYWLPIVS